MHIKNVLFWYYYAWLKYPHAILGGIACISFDVLRLVHQSLSYLSLRNFPNFSGEILLQRNVGWQFGVTFGFIGFSDSLSCFRVAHLFCFPYSCLSLIVSVFRAPSPAGLLPPHFVQKVLRRGKQWQNASYDIVRRSQLTRVSEIFGGNFQVKNCRAWKNPAGW